MRGRSGSYLLIVVLLVSSFQTIGAVRFAYVLEGECPFELETHYLTSPVLDPQLISDMHRTERYEVMRKQAQQVHEMYLSGDFEESETLPTEYESQRNGEEVSWVDLSGQEVSLHSYPLREHIMITRKLDALWIISLKKAGEMCIGRITLYHRGEEDGDLVTDELIDPAGQEEFTAWVLPVLYQAMYSKQIALLKLNSFRHGADLSLDGSPVPPSVLYIIPAGTHQITLSSPFHHTETRQITAEQGEFLSIDADLDPVMLSGMLVTGQGKAAVGQDLLSDLPFTVIDRTLPITLKASAEGYISTVLTIEGETDAVKIRLKPVAFDPSATIARVQRSFYSSLAVTMLSFAASRIYDIVTEESHPVVSNLLDGVALISAGDTVRLLFDYYTKSKYSVSTVREQ